jgi:hypothetical protein
MQGRLVSASGKWKGELLFGLQEIEEFAKDAEKFVLEPALEMPPGAPIGMPEMMW